MSLGSKFKYSNVFFKKTSLKNVLPFYRDIFINWKTRFGVTLLIFQNSKKTLQKWK